METTKTKLFVCGTLLLTASAAAYVCLPALLTEELASTASASFLELKIIECVLQFGSYTTPIANFPSAALVPVTSSTSKMSFSLVPFTASVSAKAGQVINGHMCTENLCVCPSSRRYRSCCIF